MNIEINKKFSMTVELTAFKDDKGYSKGLKTHDCDINEWYGDETCREIELSEIISTHLEDETEYKITINIEKVD